MSGARARTAESELAWHHAVSGGHLPVELPAQQRRVLPEPRRLLEVGKGDDVMLDQRGDECDGRLDVDVLERERRRLGERRCRLDGALVLVGHRRRRRLNEHPAAATLRPGGELGTVEEQVLIAIDADGAGARRPEQERVELTGERRPVRREQVARGIADRAGADRVGQEVESGRGRWSGWPHGDQRVVLDARDRQPAGDETVVVSVRVVPRARPGRLPERARRCRSRRSGRSATATSRASRRPCARSSDRRRSTRGRGRLRQRPSRWRRPAPLRVRDPATNRARAARIDTGGSRIGGAASRS